MSQFLTLMRREWMQHRTGWLFVMLAPTVLVLLLGMADGGLQININHNELQWPPLRQTPALIQTGLLLLSVTAATLALALLALGFQLPGLARRDQQDRSIEFWCSLPVSHAKSVAAMLVAQTLLLPWLSIVVGLAGGLAAAAVAINLTLGPLAWLSQPWGLLGVSIAALLLRLTFGLLLAAAWLSPLILLTLAASAWLKRWGVPVVVALSLCGTLLLDRRLAQPLVGPAFSRMSDEALRALLQVDSLRQLQVHSVDQVAVLLRDLPMLLIRDLVPLLERAATPAFLLALAGGALGFALLVLRRQRGV
jgi:ABC-2 type transport system permease protein